jgi:hypothetical protein
MDRFVLRLPEMEGRSARVQLLSGMILKTPAAVASAASRSSSSKNSMLANAEVIEARMLLIRRWDWASNSPDSKLSCCCMMLPYGKCEAGPDCDDTKRGGGGCSSSSLYGCCLVDEFFFTMSKRTRCHLYGVTDCVTE